MQINCFGRFQLYQEGKFIPITNKKAEELLAYLVCENGPVKKVKAAEVLWPNASRENARDNLYKVFRYIRHIQDSGIYIPLKLYREEIYLEMSQIECDIYNFEFLYNQGNCIEHWEKAVKLYNVPLLFENCYEWTEQAEAYYDIRFIDLVQKLIDYYQKQGKSSLVSYYRNKLL